MHLRIAVAAAAAASVGTMNHPKLIGIEGMPKNTVNLVGGRGDFQKLFRLDFGGLLSEFKPNLYFGGDMVIFWGPISWTVIFGLSFATFLTLIIVPVMYKITVNISKMVNTRLIKMRKVEMPAKTES